MTMKMAPAARKIEFHSCFLRACKYRPKHQGNQAAPRSNSYHPTRQSNQAKPAVRSPVINRVRKKVQTLAALTNDYSLLCGEIVAGHFEVQRSRTLADTARNVVVGAVARAEPATKVTSFANGHTTQVCADAYRGPVLLVSADSCHGKCDR